MICEWIPESLSVATTVTTSDPGGESSESLAEYPPGGMEKIG